MFQWFEVGINTTTNGWYILSHLPWTGYTSCFKCIILLNIHDNWIKGDGYPHFTNERPRLQKFQELSSVAELFVAGPGLSSCSRDQVCPFLGDNRWCAEVAPTLPHDSASLPTVEMAGEFPRGASRTQWGPLGRAAHLISKPDAVPLLGAILRTSGTSFLLEVRHPLKGWAGDLYWFSPNMQSGDWESPSKSEFCFQVPGPKWPVPASVPNHVHPWEQNCVPGEEGLWLGPAE